MYDRLAAAICDDKVYDSAAKHFLLHHVYVREKLNISQIRFVSISNIGLKKKVLVGFCGQMVLEFTKRILIFSPRKNVQ